MRCCSFLFISLLFFEMSISMVSAVSLEAVAAVVDCGKLIAKLGITSAFSGSGLLVGSSYLFAVFEEAFCWRSFSATTLVRD